MVPYCGERRWMPSPPVVDLIGIALAKGVYIERLIWWILRADFDTSPGNWSACANVMSHSLANMTHNIAGFLWPRSSSGARGCHATGNAPAGR